MESTFIKRILQYLIYRDVLLLAAVSTHILFYYNLFSSNKTLIYWVLGVGTLIWTLYYAKSVILYFKMKKDVYLNEAIKDEYLTQVRLKAGYHGYTAVFFVCLIFIFISLWLSRISFPITIPPFLTCEALLLAAIITDDISKMIQLKG